MSAGSPGSDIPAERKVVFTLERGFREPVLRRTAVVIAVGVLAAILGGAGFLAIIAWTVAVACGAGALLCAAMYAWMGRFRTRLSAEGIEARGYFNHFVPWTSVTGLDVAGLSWPDQQRLLTAPYLTDSGACGHQLRHRRRGQRTASQRADATGQPGLRHPRFPCQARHGPGHPIARAPAAAAGAAGHDVAERPGVHGEGAAHAPVAAGIR